MENVKNTVSEEQIVSSMRLLEARSRHWTNQAEGARALPALFRHFADHPESLRPDLYNTHSWGIDRQTVRAVLLENGVKGWPQKLEQDHEEHERGAMRSLWQQICRVMASQSGVIVDAMAENNIPFSVAPEQIPGRGRGNRARFGFTFGTLAFADRATPIDLAAIPQITYTRASVSAGGLAAWLAKAGYSLTGRSKLALYIAASVVIYALASILVFFLQVAAQASDARQALAAALLALTLAILPLAAITRLISIGRNRVGIAPAVLQRWPGGEDRIIEIRDNVDGSPDVKAVLVHYVADCPICGESGKERIRATSGGIRFFGRIVGRCSNAPLEHVFSFDHVSRQGRYLG